MLWKSFAGIFAALISLWAAVLLIQPVAAAVVFEFSLKQNVPFVVGGPWGIAVDQLGDIYSTDTGNHRIVKFDSAGNPIRAWGTEGSLPGQLYYPVAVATGTNAASGNIRVYVADNGNHRIVTYNENGKFLSAFGSEGSANNQFLNPSGLAVLPFLSGGTEQICVADPRNLRVSCFTEQGQWLKSLDCADCPDGKFKAPGGIAVRRLDGGAIRYYVSDNYPSRVVILSSSGRHLKTIGAPGQSVELAFPDDLVVDNKDGSIYVAESGFNVERVSKFSADGEWLFGFRDSPSGPLIQPHGIAIDEDGDLYVGNFADPAVHKYRMAPPRIFTVPDSAHHKNEWVDNNQAYLLARYNGVEQVCKSRVSIAITAAGRPWTIRSAVQNVAIGNQLTPFTLPLTIAQSDRLFDALQDGARVTVATNTSAECPVQGTDFTSSSTFRLQ